MTIYYLECSRNIIWYAEGIICLTLCTLTNHITQTTKSPKSCSISSYIKEGKTIWKCKKFIERLLSVWSSLLSNRYALCPKLSIVHFNDVNCPGWAPIDLIKGIDDEMGITPDADYRRCLRIKGNFKILLVALYRFLCTNIESRIKICLYSTFFNFSSIKQNLKKNTPFF